MPDYNSYTDRDAFSRALCDMVEEYLQERNQPAGTVLAVNPLTMETGLGAGGDFENPWEKYPVETFIRDNEDSTGKEVDVDATYELASKYYFVR